MKNYKNILLVLSLFIGSVYAAEEADQPNTWFDGINGTTNTVNGIANSLLLQLPCSTLGTFALQTGFMPETLAQKAIRNSLDLAMQAPNTTFGEAIKILVERGHYTLGSIADACRSHYGFSKESIQLIGASLGAVCIFSLFDNYSLIKKLEDKGYNSAANAVKASSLTLPVLGVFAGRALFAQTPVMR